VRQPPIYGLLAEFADPNELIAAARRAREEGYTHLDAYTPFPIEELAEALGMHDKRLPLIVLIGGIVGCLAGYGLQYWTAVIDYPINVGGRPFHSWPAFIPVTFECTVLVAALCAVLGMLALNGLPMPYHPVFNVPRFALASRDRFFLCIEATDPKFDADATWGFLSRQQPRQVSQVDHGREEERPE
jgi:Alternative complex III, ActD subunit